MIKQILAKRESRGTRVLTRLRVAGLVFAAVALALIIYTANGCSRATSTPEQQQEEKTLAEEGQRAQEEKAKVEEIVRKYGDKVAVIKTNKGVIKFKFFVKDAPLTVENFAKLAGRKFYDGTKWHRVVADFVIQGGDPLSKDDDPTNDGTGGPGYTIPAEFNDNPHLEGTVAMARGPDPDSAGSQFYITLSPQPELDGQYTVFGQVVKGMDVVKKIRQGDVIRSIRIEPAR